MATYRNTKPEGDLFEKVRRYISGLGYYIKPPGGIPASDLANYVLPSAVTDYSVGRLNYTKNLGTVTAIKMNNAVVPQTEGVVDLGAIQEKIDADHKISGDFIIDGLVNKVINVKPDWNAISGSDTEILNKPTIPAAQIQSDWNQSNTSAKDFIKNKPTIPTVPSNVSAFTNDAGYLTEHQDISGKANSNDLATVAFSGDYEDLTNTPTIPDVPEWAMSSTKPSYTVSEIDGAQEELVSGTNIKTINGTSVLGSGNITIQGGGGGGDVNVIESITFNGSAVPVDASKNAAITYSAPVTSVNGNTGAVTISVPTKVSDLTNDSGFITSYTETDPVFSASVAASITSADITAWNGKSTFSGSYNDLTDKPTLFSGAYADLTGKPNLATVATSGDYDDLSNKPTIPSVPSNIVTGTSSSYTIWVGTQAQYEAIATKDSTTIYLITGS